MILGCAATIHINGCGESGTLIHTRASSLREGMDPTKTAKPKLEGQALAKAKEFLAKGGSIDAIKGKYDIPAAILKTL